MANLVQAPGAAGIPAVIGGALGPGAGAPRAYHASTGCRSLTPAPPSESRRQLHRLASSQSLQDVISIVTLMATSTEEQFAQLRAERSELRAGLEVAEAQLVELRGQMGLSHAAASLCVSGPSASFKGSAPCEGAVAREMEDAERNDVLGAIASINSGIRTMQEQHQVELKAAMAKQQGLWQAVQAQADNLEEKVNDALSTHKDEQEKKQTLHCLLGQLEAEVQGCRSEVRLLSLRQQEQGVCLKEHGLGIQELQQQGSPPESIVLATTTAEVTQKVAETESCSRAVEGALDELRVRCGEIAQRVSAELQKLGQLLEAEREERSRAFEDLRADEAPRRAALTSAVEDLRAELKNALVEGSPRTLGQELVSERRERARECGELGLAVRWVAERVTGVEESAAKVEDQLRVVGAFMQSLQSMQGMQGMQARAEYVRNSMGTLAEKSADKLVEQIQAMQQTVLPREEATTKRVVREELSSLKTWLEKLDIEAHGKEGRGPAGCRGGLLEELGRPLGEAVHGPEIPEGPSALSSASGAAAGRRPHGGPGLTASRRQRSLPAGAVAASEAATGGGGAQDFFTTQSTPVKDPSGASFDWLTAAAAAATSTGQGAGGPGRRRESRLLLSPGQPLRKPQTQGAPGGASGLEQQAAALQKGAAKVPGPASSSGGRAASTSCASSSCPVFSSSAGVSSDPSVLPSP